MHFKTYINNRAEFLSLYTSKNRYFVRTVRTVKIVLRIKIDCMKNVADPFGAELGTRDHRSRQSDTVFKANTLSPVFLLLNIVFKHLFDSVWPTFFVF